VEREERINQLEEAVEKFTKENLSLKLQRDKENKANQSERSELMKTIEKVNTQLQGQAKSHSDAASKAQRQKEELEKQIHKLQEENGELKKSHKEVRDSETRITKKSYGMSLAVVGMATVTGWLLWRK